MKMDIVDFAYQVIEMAEKIRELEFENNRLRRFEHDYNELLTHSQVMMDKIISDPWRD